MNNDHTELAGCVVLDDYGRLLLLHRYIDEGQWELPGGKLEEHERPQDAATRELREELGVSVSVVRALGSATFELHDTEYKYHWFLGEIAAGQPQIKEAHLFDDFDYVAIEDLPSLALSPNMEVLHDKILTGEVVLEL